MSQASSPSGRETSHCKTPGGGCSVSRSDWVGLGALMSESHMWKLYQQQVSCGRCLSNRTGIFFCEQCIISLCLRESKSLVSLVDLIILNLFFFLFWKVVIATASTNMWEDEFYFWHLQVMSHFARYVSTRAHPCMHFLPLQPQSNFYFLFCHFA